MAEKTFPPTRKEYKDIAERLAQLGPSEDQRFLDVQRAAIALLEREMVKD
jgi:hypothetical protein